MKHILLFLASYVLGVATYGQGYSLSCYIKAAKQYSPLLYDYRHQLQIEQAELRRLKALYTTLRRYNNFAIRLKNRKAIMWKYYALLSALFAALTAIFAKVGVKDINSDLATAVRTTVILLLTWGIVLFGQHVGEIREIPRHAWLFLVLSGVATGLSWLFYFKALQTGDVSRVAPIDKLSVVITICLSFLFLKEPVSLRVVAGALLITGGSIIMLIK